MKVFFVNADGNLRNIFGDAQRFLYLKALGQPLGLMGRDYDSLMEASRELLIGGKDENSPESDHPRPGSAQENL